MMIIRRIYVPGETHSISEDFRFHDYNGNRLKACVGDWASDLKGGKYIDQQVSEFLGLGAQTLLTGGVVGRVVAELVIRESESYGEDLVKEINRAIARKYKDLIRRGYAHLSRHREDRAYTFTGYIAHVLAYPERAVITAVGDVRVAADGVLRTGKTKLIDEHNAQLRKHLIENGVSDVDRRVLQAIFDQFRFQNSSGEFSYPAIDGTETLPWGVEVIEIAPLPNNMLIWSDGYVTPDKPEEFTIEGLERKLAHVYEVDPERCREYPAVKAVVDDRTAVEIIFDEWGAPRIEDVRTIFMRRR